jgi:hypothetical protein
MSTVAGAARQAGELANAQDGGVAMAGVSGGSVNSDMQQAIRRFRGDPNNQRDPVEKALPWLALGLVLAGMIALIVNATRTESPEREIHRARAGASVLSDAAEEAGFELIHQDARVASGVGREAMVVVASDDEEVAVSWLEPSVDDLLFETVETLEIDDAVIIIGEGGDRLPRVVIDCGRSTLMVSGRLGRDVDPRTRSHRDEHGLPEDTLVEVASALAPAFDCPAGLPASGQ